VRQHVEQPAFRPGSFPGIDGHAQADQHIADVGQAGEGQQAFDLLLAEGHQVADEHVQRAKSYQQHAPGDGQPGQGAQGAQQGDQAGLDHDAGEHGADPAGGLGVGVRQPGVHGRNRHLDAEADHEQRARRQGARRQSRLRGDLRQRQRPGLGQHQGDAEQHEYRADGALHQVLDARFQRGRLRPVEGDQQVGGDGHALEPQP